MRSLKKQYVVLFLLLALLPLAVVGTRFVITMRASAYQGAVDHLESVSEIKQSALAQTVDRNSRQVQAVAQNRALVETLQAKLSQPENKGEATSQTWERQPSFQYAFEALKQLQETSWGALHHVFVTDIHGNVVISPPHGDSTASHMGQEVEHPDFPAAATGTPKITDFFGFSEKDHFHQLVLYPVKDGQGKVLGVVVAEVVIKHLTDQLAHGVNIITDDEEEGEQGTASSEVFMATLQGERIVNDKENFKPTEQHEGVGLAIQHGKAVGLFTNANGEQVIGVYRQDPAYPWVLSLEVPVEQVMAQANRATWMAVLTMGIIAVIVLALALWIAGRFTGPILHVVERAKAIANGDLSGEALVDKQRNELGQLARSVNEMSDSLRVLVSQVGQATGDVSKMTEQIAESTQQISQGMDQQSGEVSSVSAAAEEMACSISEVAEKTRHAADQANTSGQTAREGQQVVDETVAEMKQISKAVHQNAKSVSELSQRTDQIGQVTQTINDIADQTNLLALNAAIEAARAGESGRGFAVVADEVRKLADRTTKATEEITGSIEAMQKDAAEAIERMKLGTDAVDQGMEKAAASGQNLQEIVGSAQEVGELVRSIAAASDEQSGAASMISKSIESISSVTRTTHEEADKAAAIARNLAERGSQLRDAIQRFKLTNDVKDDSQAA
jgi:methyl-accepting chemotaxis protein